ncbi:hypothetical protein, partial [Burkholderia humptydooensis]|uniref:hypothetical protein n=1 Tax=Burkholderia humptydooensis TaxID=430531 RepID=UPI001CA4DE79
TSSAHTYRLFIVKEHICEKISLLDTAFSAALRCQQQRNEIMITYSQRVNNFFTSAPPKLRHRRLALPFVLAVDRTARAQDFPLPPSRRVRRSAKEA